MNKLGIAGFAVLTLAIAHPAHAQRVSKMNGMGVLGKCENPVAEQCEAYLVGFADSESAHQPKRFCIPVSVGPAEMRDKVVRYLRSRSANLNDSGATQVARALAAAYPCSK